MNVRLATFAMGTRFEIVLAGDDDEVFLRAAGEEAIEEIEWWHQRLNYFSPDSVVAEINRRAAYEPVKVDAEICHLLRRCATIFEQSEGAFDVTIAPLMHHWGLREPAQQSSARPVWGGQFIELDEPSISVRFRRIGLAIDLGAIAKGFALDRAAAILRERGVTCAFLHGGTSTAIAIGAPPGAAGWKVAIRNPSCEKGRRVVTLRDRALSVSAPHGRMVMRDGEAICHVIDPRTGAPSRRTALAAVVCDSAERADAWSTALLVLGEMPENVLTGGENFVVPAEDEAISDRNRCEESERRTAAVLLSVS